MAKLGLCLLLLFFFFHIMVSMVEPTIATNSSATNSSTTNFIKASCKVTSYFALCVHSLSSYASTIQQSDQQLTQASLSVSLARARLAAVYVSKMTKTSGIKPREYQAVKDCIANIGDAIYELNNSVQELGHMGKAGAQDFEWHMSNVQTWVSTALTKENTCLDGFAVQGMDGNVKTAIKNRVTIVAQLTSNAVALASRYAARHRACSTTNVP
ncbi:21 kDa protein-like [Cornus florida]|uniref:21 kDa protein-like n=1 Tax=Cornus florida TaxID=4283 RepID=UPI00289D6204|nr:21 kDa protein-like [Cornus florida]